MPDQPNVEVHPTETPAGGEAKGAARIARTYAEALMNVADKRDRAEEIGEELQSLVHDVFKADSRLEALLVTPTVKRSAKEPLIRRAFEGKASDLMLDFLITLNRHDRLGLLRNVFLAYRDIRDVRAKRIRVTVRSVVPLTEQQQSELKRTIEAATKLEPILEQRIDPDLLGGMIVQVGDDVFDSSVRTRIETIRNHLLARSSYEIQTGRDRFSNY